MELRVNGWISTGLRCPDLAVDLVGGAGRRGVVSIIQMPNGTGKTTTLELLRAALTGSARDWTPTTVEEYRARDGGDEGYFRVDLQVDGRPLVFELTLDFGIGRVFYRTTSPAIGGQRDGWEPPPEIRRFLQPGFINLIVFDGEFASDLLDARKTNAAQAVDAMSQLYLFDRARHLAQQERDRIVREAGGTGSRQSLKKTENQLAAVISQIARIRKARVKCAEELEDGEVEELRLQKEFDKEISRRAGNDERLVQARTRVESAERALHDDAATTFTTVRVPALLSPAFRQDLRDLKQGMTALQLPPTTSRQFFMELAEQADCVCGRPMDESSRATIIETAETYLGQHQAGVLNAIKAQIDATLLSVENGESIEAPVLVERLTDRIDEYHRARTDLNELEEELAGPGDDLSKLQKQLEEIRKKNEERRGVLEEIDRPADPSDKVDSMSLAGLQQRRRQLERKLETLTGTVDIGERTRVITELLDRAKETARDVVKKQLVNKGNELLERVLRQSPIKIEGIDSHIRLHAQGDASVGQKLAVGYVMLGGLLHRGAHSLPFIVDSPANPIDHTVRREIATILPRLCDQFITFVISSEKQAFTSVLGESAESCQFITIYRKLEATDKYTERLPEKAIQSDRFVLVEDREFFDAFDMDAE